jgi:hypothetical protein
MAKASGEGVLNPVDLTSNLLLGRTWLEWEKDEAVLYGRI